MGNIKIYTVEELFDIDKDEASSPEVICVSELTQEQREYLGLTTNAPIKTQVQLSAERRSDMLCGALEGGSNYWYFLGDDSDAVMKTFIPDLAKQRNKTPFVDLMWKAIQAGAKIPVRDAEDEETILGYISMESIVEGEKLMFEQAPSHFGDIIKENDDANTADVWFQYAVLKDIVYG